MRRLLAVIVALLLAGRPASARLRAEVMDFGETTADRQRPAAAAPGEDSLVPRTEIEHIQFVSHTTAVSAQLCLRFGVSIHLTADPQQDRPRQLSVVITRPPITRPDGQSSAQDRFPTPVLGDWAYAGYTFDHDWEMQPGDWTIAFLAEGQVLASKTFSVRRASAPASVCRAPTS